MQHSFTAHQVESMRRDAMKRARASDMTYSKALDQIAEEHGYRNWSLLQKNGITPSDQPQPYLFRRTTGEVTLAMRVVPEPRSRTEHRRPAEIARDTVQAVDSKFVSAANAVDFAVAYVESVLAQPRFKLSTKSVAFWEMRPWLPYAALPAEGTSHILVNRLYKPQGSTTAEFVDYAKYPQLQLKLRGESWRSFAHPTAKDPFLFNDALAPWSNRGNAEAYLVRLKDLRKQL